jgi:peptidoglycan/LPS O-acetylase OafA/YrhL
VPSPAPSTPQRVAELDGVRGLAILLVLLYHYIAIPIPPDAGRPLSFVRQLFSNTWSGVDLFFVLSGFLIGGILIEHRSAGNYFRVFYTRRISRIFPLYYFFLALFLLLQWLSPRLGVFSQDLFYNPLPIAPYLVYLQNFAMAIRGTFGNEFLAMTWSLAIEEHFYLLLPLLVWRSHPDRLPITLLFFVALSVILRATLAPGSYISFVVTPWRLDALFLGVLLSVLVRRPALFEAVTSRRVWVKAVAVALLIFIAYSSFREPLGSLDHLLVFGLFYAAMLFLMLSQTGGPLTRFFRRRWLVSLGRYSYAIYLFHQMVNGMVHDILFHRPPVLDSLPTALATVLSFALVCLVALGTYRAFERHFIELGHRSAYSIDEHIILPGLEE